MPVRVDIPIRIRVDPLALTERQNDLEEALAAAVGRALKNSRDVVVAQRGGYVGVKVHSPEFIWSGDGLANIPGGVRSEIIKLVTNILERTTQSAGIDSWSSNSKKLYIPLPQNVSELFDGNRYDSSPNTYTIPTYQPTSQPNNKPPVSLSVQGIPKVIPPLSIDDEALSRQLSSADVKERRDAFSISLADRLQDGDINAFRLALLAIRVDNTDPTARVLEELTYFAKKHPQEFLRVLRILLNDKATEIGGSLQRTSQFPTLGVARDLLEKGDIAVAAGIVRVAREIPIARQLLQEREQLTKGTNRLIGLVDALVEIRRQLHRYLKGQQDKIETDSSILDKIDSITNILPLFSGIFAAIAGQVSKTPNSPNIYDLEVDLLENYRWISRILEKIYQIDSQIRLYKFLYGEAADDLDELEILNTARIGYLADVINNPFPMASNITKMLKERESFSDDWIGQTADKKLERLKQAIKIFKDDLEKLLKQGASQMGGGYRSVDTEYNRKLNELRTSVAELEKEINSVKPQQRDINHLNQVRSIEQQIPLVKVRLSLLPYWFAFLQLMGFIDKGTGFASERRYWHSVVDPESAEVIKQYANPDYAELGNLQRTWKNTIEHLQKWVKIALGQDVAFTLALTVVAIVVTVGVGSVVGAEVGGTVVVTLAEAGTFTAITTVGKAFLLDKPTDLGDVIGEFAENALLFGTFRALTSGASLIAKAIAPQRTLVQFGIVFGVPAVASALPVGIPLIIKKVETGEWPEETGTVVLNTILMTTLTAVLGGSKLREALRVQILRTNALRALALQDMLMEIDLLSRGEIARRRVIQQFIAKNKYPSEAEFESLQSLGVSIFSDLKKLLDRIANNLTKNELASLELTREMVKELAQTIDEIGKNIEKAHYRTVTSFRALLPPNEIIGAGLVPTASGTFEYNPSSPSLQLGALRTKLLQAGYQVTDQGGGVLHLTAPKGEGPSYLLLPTAEPGKPTFGRPLLERATGWRLPSEMAEIKIALEKINPNLLKTLKDEFPDETALDALNLLVEQRSKIQNDWRVDAIRGLAEMLRLERGITRATVQRLFERLPAERLSGLFEKYFNLVSNPNTKSIVSLLVESGLPTFTSEFLIDACDAIRRETGGKFKFPDKMSRRAIRGLVKFFQDNPGDYVQKLVAIPLEQRLSRLEGLVTPGSVQALGSVEAILQSHLQEIRPGLNLLHGTPSDVLQVIEKLIKPKGGQFSESSVRDEFLKLLESYQKNVDKLKAGENVQRNAIGDLNEILANFLMLERGCKVMVVGKKSTAMINLQDFNEIQIGGIKLRVLNGKLDMKIQFDSVALTADGELVVLETTTGKLSLPKTGISGWDRKIGQPSGNVVEVDIAQFEQLDSESSRKIIQMIKHRFFEELGKSIVTAFQVLSGSKGTIKLPNRKIASTVASKQVKDFAKWLNFEVESSSTVLDAE